MSLTAERRAWAPPGFEIEDKLIRAMLPIEYAGQGSHLIIWWGKKYNVNYWTTKTDKGGAPGWAIWRHSTSGNYVRDGLTFAELLDVLHKGLP